jgi:hypothetical protein
MGVEKNVYENSCRSFAKRFALAVPFLHAFTTIGRISKRLFQVVGRRTGVIAE